MCRVSQRLRLGTCGNQSGQGRCPRRRHAARLLSPWRYMERRDAHLCRCRPQPLGHRIMQGSELGLTHCEYRTNGACFIWARGSVIAFGDRSAHTKACLDCCGLDQAHQGTRCALTGLDPLAQARAQLCGTGRLSRAVKDGEATAKRGHAVASFTAHDRHSTIDTALWYRHSRHQSVSKASFLASS
ncbi:MAG: hypothetical protein RL186_1023 [Pseudomonadota bacterium]|jgi:hypothetical protein